MISAVYCAMCIFFMCFFGGVGRGRPWGLAVHCGLYRLGSPLKARAIAKWELHDYPCDKHGMFGDPSQSCLLLLDLKLQTVNFVPYLARRRHRSLILRTDDLMLLPGAMNEVNPALNISDETIESLVSTFVRLREVLLSTSFLSSFHLPFITVVNAFYRWLTVRLRLGS